MDIAKIRKMLKEQSEEGAQDSEVKEQKTDIREEKIEEKREEREVRRQLEERSIEKVAGPAVPSEVRPPEKIKEAPPKEIPTLYALGEIEVEILSFRLGGEAYGVRISRVKEIVKPLPTTSVPRTPAYLEGITSLRGDIIPVLDLRKRFGLEGAGDEKKKRILILSVREEVMGGLVDEVKGVVRVREDSIEPPPFTVTGVEAEFLEGVARMNKEFISLLNIEEVMKIE